MTAYGLTFAGFLLLGGRAADLLGRRRVLMAGLAVFTAASLAGGLATSDIFLIVMRGIQGLGTALVLLAALSTVTNMFSEGAERNKAFGIWGGAPLLPLRLFRLGSVAGANAVGFLLGTSFLTFVFLGTLYMQQVLGFSALATGAAWMTALVTSLACAGLSQRLVTRTSPKLVMAIGMALIGAGTLWATRALWVCGLTGLAAIPVAFVLIRRTGRVQS